MNIQRCEPLKAKRAFRAMPYIHFGISGGLFAVAFAGLVFLNVNLLLALLVAGIAAFGLYLYLESRVLVITCPYCKRDINTNTPWLCGFKGCHNLNVDEFPFVHECENENCRYIPKAYICHHCEKPIYLTTDQQKMHAAKRLENLGLPVKTVTVIIDPTKDKVLKQKDEISDLQHELGVTTLKKQIDIVKNVSVNAPAAKSPAQILEDEITMSINQGMTLYDIENRLKAKAEIEYANDEHKLAQKLALIQNEIQKRIP